MSAGIATEGKLTAIGANEKKLVAAFENLVAMVEELIAVGSKN